MKLGEEYTTFIEARRNFRALGILLICASLLAVTAAQIAGNEAARAGAFTMFCLGLYSCSLADFQGRLARLQAALDMKRIAMDMQAKPAPLVVQEERLKLGGDMMILRARDGTYFAIQLKGISPEHASIRVEYVG